MRRSGMGLPFGWILEGLPVMLALLVALAGMGCTTEDKHGDATQENEILDGQYFYVNFEHATATTISPDLLARAGVAEADGAGTLHFFPQSNFGTALSTLAFTYSVNTNHQINNTLDHPGGTLPGGEFFQIGDQERATGQVGLWFYGQVSNSLNIYNFVDGATNPGFYHAVMLRFNRPGIIMATGNASLLKTGGRLDEASWVIDYTTSQGSTLSRMGALRVSDTGAFEVQDITTSRTYFGFGEPHGDWIYWLDVDTRTGQIFRMDMLIRKGQGLSVGSLDGRYNLVGFYQESTGTAVDTIFGRIQFDGEGAYYDFTWRNSFGTAYTTGNEVYPYTVTSDGRVTFVGGTNPIGYVSRDPARRMLIFPDVSPQNDAGTLGFFMALRK